MPPSRRPPTSRVDAGRIGGPKVARSLPGGKRQDRRELSMPPGRALASEALLYPTNRQYIAELLDKTGDGTGQTLELLADYLLAVMPGCRTYRRKQTYSTDHDIVCSLDGVELDFRSELGRYFVCESKDWSRPADFTAFAKFARVLDSTKSRFGILFSRAGITGEERTRDAAREQLKLFQDRGIVVVVVSLNDIKAVIDGYNFITLLREKYERVRLDLYPGRSAQRPARW